MSRELPIIFDAESVMAILAGRKTQTRRVIPHKLMRNADLDVNDSTYIYFADKYGDSHHARDCAPYRKDDLLWVRETWRPFSRSDECACYDCCDCPPSGTPLYAADFVRGYDARPWKSPVTMPKVAARIWLRVTDVRAELLQDISEDDARMEGVSDPWNYQIPEYYEDVSVRHRDYYAAAFAGRWDRLNAKRGYPWKDNPWVWVHEFKVERMER